MRLQIIILVLVAACCSTMAQTRNEATGAVVAYLRAERCDACEKWHGDFSVTTEHWIVKLNQPQGKPPKYYLAKYHLYEGGPPNSLFDHLLTFIFEPVDSNSDCAGRIIEGKNGKKWLRPAQLKDFEPTSRGRGDSLKDFRSYPCIVIDSLPKVVAP
jgi:hypothetical protein